jgi:hypothetical protein
MIPKAFKAVHKSNKEKEEGKSTNIFTMSEKNSSDPSSSQKPVIAEKKFENPFKKELKGNLF